MTQAARAMANMNTNGIPTPRLICVISAVDGAFALFSLLRGPIVMRSSPLLRVEFDFLNVVISPETDVGADSAVGDISGGFRFVVCVVVVDGAVVRSGSVSVVFSSFVVFEVVSVALAVEVCTATVVSGNIVVFAVVVCGAAASGWLLVVVSGNIVVCDCDAVWLMVVASVDIVVSPVVVCDAVVSS